jgi:adenylate cyclase
VHSGEVVAGVIGRQKFAYDLWGDTVNVASRMESNGVPGESQISAETRQLLSAHYRAVPRGEIEIKGHLPRMTYLLQGTGG